VVTTDASGTLSSSPAASLDATTASNGLTRTGTDIALGGTLAASTDVALNSKNLTFSGVGNVGIGTTTANSRLSISPSSVEAKITLYDGGSTTNHYGFGVSNGQLNYHVDATTANHVFYAGGKNGNGTELLRVQGNGSVGIGTAPAGGLHIDRPEVGGTTGLGVILGGGTTGNPSIELRGSGKTPYVDFSETSGVDYTTRLRSIGGVLNVEGAGGGGGLLFRVNGSIQATNVTFTSDARFKTNIRPLGSALASVLALRGVRYEWNALGVQHGGTAGAGQVGLIAQEVEAIYPELVSTDAQGYKAVNYAQLTPVLLEALKELKAENDALQARTTTATATAAAAAAKADAATAALESLSQRLRALEAGGGQARK
jgi:hypothetical protein